MCCLVLGVPGFSSQLKGIACELLRTPKLLKKLSVARCLVLGVPGVSSQLKGIVLAVAAAEKESRRWKEEEGLVGALKKGEKWGGLDGGVRKGVVEVLSKLKAGGEGIITSISMK